MGAMFGDLSEYKSSSSNKNSETNSKIALSLDSICDAINSGKIKNIITMAGAGISTSCGIPDFRSPGTGLYDNLSKYNLPSPQSIFEMNYFSKNPTAFYMLAKELFFKMEDNFKPSITHFFIRVLQEKGLLLRHYTQNVDGLENAAGIIDDKLVEAHGHFRSAHCIKCQTKYEPEFIRKCLYSNTNENEMENDSNGDENKSSILDNIPYCLKCKGIIKPDIVFFGESLPKRYEILSATDFGKCDLLIIMGTSLKVYPFAGLVSEVPEYCLRLYLNKDRSGGRNLLQINGESDNTTDVFVDGGCDESVLRMCEMLGWTKDLYSYMNISDDVSEDTVNVNNNNNGSVEDDEISAVDKQMKNLQINDGKL